MHASRSPGTYSRLPITTRSAKHSPQLISRHTHSHAPKFYPVTDQANAVTKEFGNFSKKKVFAASSGLTDEKKLAFYSILTMNLPTSVRFSHFRSTLYLSYSQSSWLIPINAQVQGGRLCSGHLGCGQSQVWPGAAQSKQGRLPLLHSCSALPGPAEEAATLFLAAAK